MTFDIVFRSGEPKCDETSGRCDERPHFRDERWVISFASIAIRSDEGGRKGFTRISPSSESRTEAVLQVLQTILTGRQPLT